MQKARACLSLLQEKSAAWRGTVRRGNAVGIACHESFETGSLAHWKSRSRIGGRGFIVPQLLWIPALQ
jgi:hypothetical protein